jgi:hypothetical protein
MVASTCLNGAEEIALTMVPSPPRSSTWNTVVCGGSGQSVGKPSPYGVAAGLASPRQVDRSAACSRSCSARLSAALSHPPRVTAPRAAAAISAAALLVTVIG